LKSPFARDIAKICEEQQKTEQIVKYLPRDLRLRTPDEKNEEEQTQELELNEVQISPQLPPEGQTVSAQISPTELARPARS
jgi:hypothetical protein